MKSYNEARASHPRRHAYPFTLSGLPSVPLPQDGQQEQLMASSELSVTLSAHRGVARCSAVQGGRCGVEDEDVTPLATPRQAIVSERVEKPSFKCTQSSPGHTTMRQAIHTNWNCRCGMETCLQMAFKMPAACGWMPRVGGKSQPRPS